jgi:hypothetical protein
MESKPRTERGWVDCNVVGLLHHWKRELVSVDATFWRCIRPGCPVSTRSVRSYEPAGFLRPSEDDS